ncbi:carbonic anhydrase [Pseudobacillus wudalianchiensis]|uniref:Carbonic anhydrase n=1 Tax=Pseudobacillus wudalianchiensis TaxID=1743143 RepID=A0A1B9B7I6_9BACI|nr:carbonic anhydrase [Bacillus wudalianchiensis]OCA92029.1 carbonic anhydrase [Bacillus wudalianchiensis]
MNVDKNKKALFLMDIENELEPILQEMTHIRSENVLAIQNYDTDILHPYGDIMRSVILAIYRESVEEVFVIGTKEKRTFTVNIPTQLESMKDKTQTLDYLFQNCMPEFSGGTVNEWLNGKGNSSDNIEKSVEIIRHHPLVPSHVKVQGLIVDKRDEKSLIVEVPETKTNLG